MTYTPEQARAMVRAAVRWAREMPEASEDAIVARVLKDAEKGLAGKAAGVEIMFACLPVDTLDQEEASQEQAGAAQRHGEEE